MHGGEEGGAKCRAEANNEREKLKRLKWEKDKKEQRGASSGGKRKKTARGTETVVVETILLNR